MQLGGGISFRLSVASIDCKGTKMACITRVRLFSTLTMLLVLILHFVLPTTAQTSSSSSISISQVDDSAFPQVDVSITVQGSAASTPLTVADFQLFEDGQRIPASSILVEAGDRQPLSLVIAVDISTETADLEQIVDGLLALIGRLNPGDQAMLIAFYDEVRLVQPLTGDFDQLRSALRQLSISGNFTALNRATNEAFAQAQSLPPGQSAILIVTDSVENINRDVVNIDEPGAIPVYIVSFSPKSQAPGVMATFAQAIGAELTLVDTATAAQVRLQTLPLASASRPYTVRFTSAIPADNNNHTISINLSNGNAGDRDNGLFLARAGAVTIATPSLANGDRIGGFVSVTPEISAPAPVQQVEYLLNGQSLAVLDTAPYAYTFDMSAVTPGNNVVGVRVVDIAGNIGKHLVTVTVVDPLQVAVRTQPEQYYLGDQVQVIADVTALNGISSVDFLLNDVMVAEIVSPPYVFTLDTTDFGAGAVPLVVRARDATGYAKSTDAQISLTAPPPLFLFTEQVWLRILVICAIVLTFLLAWLLVWYLGLLARRQRRARFQLELQNQGNQVSAFLIRADNPKGLLTFSFLLNGQVLRGRTIVDWVRVKTAAPRQEGIRRSAGPVGQPQYSLQPTATQAVQPVAANNQQKPATHGNDRSKGTQSKSVNQRFSAITTFVLNASRAFSGLFGALGQILPRKWGGESLQRASAGASQAYTGSMRAYRINQEIEGVQDVAKLGKSALPAGPVTGATTVGQVSAQFQTESQPQSAALVETASIPGQIVTQAPPLLSSVAPTMASSTNGTNGYQLAQIEDANLRYDADGVAYRRVERLDLDATWTQTPEVSPGDVLLLELLIEPKRVGWTRIYPFQIRSVSLADAAGTPLITDDEVKIRGVSWLLWFVLPMLVVVTATFVVLYMVAFLLSEFGLLPVLPYLPIPWPLFALV